MNLSLHRTGSRILLVIAALMMLSVTVFGIDGFTNLFLARYLPGYIDPEKPPVSVEQVFSASEIAAINEVHREVETAVSEEETRRIISTLGTLDSRVVGYPGNKAAYDYVRRAFTDIGLQDVRTDTFRVTTPMDQGAHLTIVDTDERIPVYAFWPNRARTSTLPREGITGPLVYAGRGHWSDFDGKPVDDSIVLMDFDSADRYLNARMLGAEAIVFFDNGVVTRGQAENKVEEVPINIPRYWMEREDALRLLDVADRHPVVHMQGRMTWETVDTWNIYGVIPGSNEIMPDSDDSDPVRWRDKVVLVQAHYDAMSVVPARAPGAESAAGIAGLLQVARAVKQYNPGYTFVFLATSAHFEALSGISDFLYRHARTSNRFLEQIPEKDRIPIDLFVGFDLSGGTNQIAGFCFGSFDWFEAQQKDSILKQMVPYSRRLEDYAETLYGDEAALRYQDGVLPTQRTPDDLVPAFIAMDHEVASRVGLKALSFVTTGDIRSLVDTPADHPESVRIDNLTRQIETAAGLLLGLSRDPKAFEDVNVRRQDLGHDLNGRVVQWDRSIDFFTPKKPISGALVTIPTSWGSNTGVRTLLTTIADEAGKFSFRNVPAMTTLLVRSYLLDDDGAIIFAPDRGAEGVGMFPIDVRNNAAVIGCVQVLFECRPLDLMETVDPSTLSELEKLTVLGADNSVPRRFGHDFHDEFGGKSGVVYVEPGMRVKVLAGSGATSIQYLMTNTPEEMLLNPVPAADISEDDRIRAQGVGYTADEGYIPYPTYETARNLWVLDDIRLNGMIRHGVKNDRASFLHREARVALMNALQALQAQNYSAFVAASRKAWGLEVRAYPDIKGTADDTIKAVIFYFILVLPFAFFMERMFFCFSDIRKQMAAFGGIFILVFLVLQRVHPAFKLSLTPYVVFLAFIIMALGIIVIFVLLSKFDSEMKKIKHRAVGLHETDIGRLSATSVAIDLGMSNLRKRKVRSSLTAVTLILLTFTVLSFTSYSTSIQFYKLVRSNTPGYQGALIRDPNWRSMDNVLRDYLESAFSDDAMIVSRATWMSRFIASRVDYENPETAQKSFVTSLMGLSPEEPLVTRIDSLLVGDSRWFQPGDREVCILPTTVAERVGITTDQIGTATIRMMGNTYRVIGFIDSEGMDDLHDLDDERLTPISFIVQGGLAESEFQSFISLSSGNHISAHNTLILPYTYLMEIDGSLRSVALIPKNSDPEGVSRFFEKMDSILSKEHEPFYQAIEDFLARVSMAIFVGQEKQVTVYSTIGVTDVSGLKRLVIPILIAALLVLNTMMGAVYERFREIGVYSAVGLAPSHVSALFLAEACVFATIGVVVGYLLGQATTMVLTSLHLLEGLSLNYSSMSAVMSSVIVLVVVILSAVYPAKKAADMSVQDVTRRWVLPEPEGDTWRFEFPFTVSHVEALALCAYLSRVFQAHEHGVAEGFVVDDTHIEAFQSNGQQAYRLEASTWLAPFDLGVSQLTTLEMVPAKDDEKLYHINVILRHKSGDLSSWTNLNRSFLKLLRKRFLVWRTMGQALKEEYAEEGRQVVGRMKDEG